MKNVKLKLVNVDGESTVIEVPAGIAYVTIETEEDSINVFNCIAIADRDHAPGSIATRVIVNDGYFNNTPTMDLTVGKMDDEGFVWRTGAKMYVSDAGRILGQNNTTGYASSVKPLATKPWTRREIRGTNRRIKERIAE